MTNKDIINTLLEQLKSPMDVFFRIEKLNLLRDAACQEQNDELIKSSCKALITLINKNLSFLSFDEKMKAYEILKDAHTVYGAYNFESFLIAMEWNRPVEKRFYQPRMRVLKPVVQDLQDLGDGIIDVYILSMPPRVGKTTIGLFFIAWLMGRHPEEHVFAAGYASGLVGTFYKGVLDFIDSPEYRFYDIFPELRNNLNKSAENKTIDLYDDGRYKTCTFRSIDGQITGALEASSLLYLDDMCSGIEEAMNLDRLNKLWSKVTVDLLQRRVKNKRTKRLAPMLVIGTIWSVHDPISKLKEEYKDNAMFRDRVMPAINIEGESNFDYEYDAGFTTDMYLDQKAKMDEVSWECVYQQNPIERDGLLFSSGELRRYLQLPDREPDSVLSSCDVAFGGDDFLSFPILYVYDDAVYMTDVVFRKKADYKVTEPMVTGKILEHKVQWADFESDRGGDFYARDVDAMIKATSTHKCNITYSPAPSMLAKMTRIIQYAPDIKQIYFKDTSLYKPTDDYGLFMTNLTTFTQTGSSKNDDAPDSLARFCAKQKNPLIGKVSSGIGIRRAM